MDNKKYVFSELATFRYGKMPKKGFVKENGEYPVFSGYRYTGYCDEFNVDENQLIVVARGVGGTGDVKFTKEKCFLTNLSIAVDIVRTDLVLAEYLYYYFLYNNLRYLDSGSAQSQITISDLEKVEIELPPMEEQVKRVDYLSLIDEKIDTNESITEYLDELLRIEFKKRFIDAENTAEWNQGYFENIIESTLSGDWGKEKPTGNHIEKVYCVRGADIPEVKAGNKGKMPTRYILRKNLDEKKLMPGDLVVEISGGSPTQSTGRIAPITDSLLDRYDEAMVCTNFCRAIKPKTGYSMFIYLYWQYLYDKNVFFNYENGTTGIKNLDLSGFIGSEEILIPPIEQIFDFNHVCETVMSQIYNYGLMNEKLLDMRDLLLRRIIAGNMSVSEVDIDE